MLFSEYYNIKLKGDENWFDPTLENDTLLFIDPMLVFQTDVEELHHSKQKIINFFQYAFEIVTLAKGKTGKYREVALDILSFKETQETKLGYCNYGSGGSGIGREFARKVFDAMVDFIDLGLEGVGAYISPFSMFAEGIGADRISDIITDIIKKDLIIYTQKICKEKNIPTQEFLIKNFEFNREIGWVDKKTPLPKDPTTNKGIILVPKSFLRTHEVLEIIDFQSYLSYMENEELRKKSTRIIAGNLDKEKLKEIAKQHPSTLKDLLEGYIQFKEKQKNLPYDLKNDPNLLYWFTNEIEKLKKDLPKIESKTEDFESLKKFVESVLNQFKSIVEGKEGYKLLFNDDETPKKEKASQILFWGISETMCKLNGKISVSREAQTGRGPVDFKFSHGYLDKIQVEIKLASSGQLYSGLEKQFVTYLEADETCLGYYVPIKLLGRDNARVIRLEGNYEKFDDKIKQKIKILSINAYPGEKKSASKVK